MHVHLRLQLHVRYQKVLLHAPQLLLRPLQEVLGVLVAGVKHDFRRRIQVGLIGHVECNLVPDVLEITRVIEDTGAEDLRVRELQDSPAVLVTVDPVADLQHAGIEEAHVDDVARAVANLNAVTGVVDASGEDRDTSRDAEQRLFEGDSQACADQAEERAVMWNQPAPNESYDDYADHEDGRAEQLAVAIEAPRVLDARREQLLADARDQPAENQDTCRDAQSDDVSTYPMHA